MAQHDFNIDNQSAPAFRGDLNNALEALGTLSSGATAPATTYANMLWYDTANNILKMRSEADDAWIDLGTLDQGANTFTPAGLTNLTQGQAEDDTSTVFGQVSGQRLAQAVAASGAIQLIESKVPSGNPSSLDFFFDPDEWRSIHMEISNLIPVTDGTELWLRTSSDGSTFDGGLGEYATNVYGDRVGSSFFSGGFDSQSFGTVSPLSFAEVSNATADGGISGTIDFSNPGAAHYPTYRGKVSFVSDNGQFTLSECGGVRLSSSRLRGVRLLWNSGNFRDVGEVNLYGAPR